MYISMIDLICIARLMIWG